MKKQPPNKKRTALKRVPPEQPRKKKQSEEERSNQSLLKRVIFGEEKPDLTELEAGSTTILDILSPTTVDTKSKDYIVVDGVYHAYLYVTGYGYSTTVGSCWLAPLVEAGEGINMSFLIRRQSKEKILSKISQTTMMNRSRMREVGDTRQDYEELDSAISSGLYLKDVMNRQGEDFYYMHTLIEVTAPDPETMEQRATEVEKLCVSVDMIARRCDYKNEQAFLSSLPILALDPDIERKARRNALTSGVAAAFPFASYELSDHNGIFLGLNLYNRSPVFLDPYDDYKYTNGNWWIGGTDTGVKAAGEKGEKGDTGANGKDGSCVGYFSAHGETNSWGKLPLVVKKESGGLISYNSSNNTITLSKGHTYSLVFSGTVAVSANGDDRTCVVALADGYSNDIGLDTQISTIIPKNGQTARLTVAYNTIYTAEENIVLTFQYINMMSMYTNFGGSRYNITIIALN